MFLIDCAYKICGRFVKKRKYETTARMLNKGISVIARKITHFKTGFFIPRSLYAAMGFCHQPALQSTSCKAAVIPIRAR